jgi:hypothetical protein
MRLKRITVIALSTAALLGSLLGPSTATAADSDRPLTPEITKGSDQAAPAPSGPMSSFGTAGTDCSKPGKGGRIVCLETTEPGEFTGKPSGGFSAQTIQEIPEWCIENAYRGTFGTRTRACRIQGLTYTTYVVSNGVRTTTGQASLNVINYSYSATDLPAWAHQFEVSAYSGWGDALKAQMDATASSSGECTTTSQTFKGGGVSPLNSWRQGEAFFDTTVSVRGDIGNCTTTWSLTFTNPPYDPASISYAMDDIRCDNAASGTTTIGCVVPWYASAVYYSRSTQPTLALHVARAQNSGLPGATFAAPLNRTTDQATIDANRAKACGDAPSVVLMSCDEYPLASTLQGLSAGGERRSFTGCLFPFVPERTGPTGVSVCMIDERDNHSQGGTMSAFYTRERVLDGDPYRVIVTG